MVTNPYFADNYLDRANGQMSTCPLVISPYFELSPMTYSHGRTHGLSCTMFRKIAIPLALHPLAPGYAYPANGEGNLDLTAGLVHFCPRPI